MPRLLPSLGVLAALTAATLTTSACPEPAPCATVDGDTPFDIGHACGACAPTVEDALRCCTEHVGLPSDDLDATEQVVRCFAGAHGLPYPQYGEVMAMALDRDPIRGRPHGYAWRVWSLHQAPCDEPDDGIIGSMIHIDLLAPLSLRSTRVSPYSGITFPSCPDLIYDDE